MLDAVRHRFVQNVQTSHVAAAPRLNIEQHTAAPHCIPDEQCQKTKVVLKNLFFSRKLVLHRLH
jgi:hypothetical protein